jgi:hypothetical protein
MDIVNPLAGAILQSTQVQRQIGADKQRQIRRAQVVSRDAGASGEQPEHQVESTEGPAPIHDEDPRPQQRRRRRPLPGGSNVAEGTDDQPHLDVTA